MPDLGIDIDIDLEAFEDRARPVALTSPVHRQHTAPLEAAPQGEVLVDGQVGQQPKVLVDEAEPNVARVLLGVAVGQWPAVHQDRGARVGRVDTGEALDDRGLSGAVLAQECMDLARTDVEAHVRQRHLARERLPDAAQLEGCGLAHRPSPSQRAR